MFKIRVQEKKKPKKRRSKVDGDILEEKVADAIMNTIHGGFASGGETMVARMRHVKEVEVATVRKADPKYFSLTLCLLIAMPRVFTFSTMMLLS